MDNKLILLMDQDGPLADFDRKAFDVCQANGWELEVMLEEQTARYMTDHVVDAGHRRALRDLINSPGWYRDLPVTPGAEDGMAELLEHPDIEVWICTKPLEKNTTCRDDKAAWLVETFRRLCRRLGIELDRRLIITPDKSMVRGHLLVDDAPKLKWLTDPVHPPVWAPVIFPAPFNQHPESDWAQFPTWGWGDPVEKLFELAYERQGAHHERLIPDSDSAAAQ